jgi:parallel beta-helix repeat protein
MGERGSSFTRRVRGLSALSVVIGAGAGLAFMGPVTQAGASPGGTLFVNATSGHDTSTCRLQNHPCQTIAFALTQATQGSTIEVSAGNYPQQLVIKTNVTIAGPTSGTANIEPSTLPVSDADTDSTQPQDAIVDVTPGVTASLKHLTINGSSASTSFGSGCPADDFVGVYYHDASGTLANDSIKNVVLPPASFGCQDGLAVYVATDQNTTPASSSNVTMNADKVTDYDKNGITCDDPATSCTITGSTVSGIGPTGAIAQNGIQLADATSGTVTGNTVTANSYTGGGTVATGMLIFQTGALSVTGNTVSANDVNTYVIADSTGPAANGAWTISGNTVTDASDNVPGGTVGNGIGDGIDVDSTTNPVTISGNTVTGGAENGISLFSTSNTTIGGSTAGTGNTISGNGGDGIYVGGPGSSVSTAATGNTVQGNKSSKNGQDGILADTLSASNTFTANTLKKDVRFDIEDLGSMNTWTMNTCKPLNDSSPSGLCAS